MNMPEQLRDELSYLSVITNRESFAALIENEHPHGSYGYKLMLDAYDTSERAHGARRRHSGEREFKHALRCALNLWVFCGVRDPHRIAAEFLHDLTETFRKKWRFERIGTRFGEATADHVRHMTKPVQKRGMSKHDVEREFYRLLKRASREDVENKGVDVLDNLLTLWKRSVKRLARKIDDVVRYVLPLLHRHGLNKLCRAILLVLWEIRRKLRSRIAFAH
jgi:(p)ppGpp synthase/HD superfamily hydrolase